MRRVIGLMSGTSLDGVDAAWVETDGESVARCGARLTLPYDPVLRRDLRSVLEAAPTLEQADAGLADAVRRLTERHVEAVEALRREEGGRSPDLIGFHGQTILHRPAERRTWQVGDAALLARRTGVPVVHDFRSADVAAGGQGAPLVPVVHAVLAVALPKPLAVLNLGGVGNVTWIGTDGALLGFDTGPANGPLDDWVQRRAGLDCDLNGVLSLSGTPDASVLDQLLRHPYLTTPPPKSLDRLDFAQALVRAGLEALSPADGAATLVGFAAACVAAAARHLPAPPVRWLVTGGGRRNPSMMSVLSRALDAPLQPVEAVGWDGDALEAQAFAVLAVRAERQLPLTFPGTTGAPEPLSGGQVVYP